MNTYLTLDLNDKVTSAQREKMYSKLKELGWTKLMPVTTLWSKSWTAGCTVESYEKEAFKEAGNAATFASVSEYEATVIVTLNMHKTVKVPPTKAVGLVKPPASLLEATRPKTLAEMRQLMARRASP